MQTSRQVATPKCGEAFKDCRSLSQPHPGVVWSNLYAAGGAWGVPYGPWYSGALGAVSGGCLTPDAGGRLPSGVGGRGPVLGLVISCMRLYPELRHPPMEGEGRGQVRGQGDHRGSYKAVRQGAEAWNWVTEL